MPGQKCCVCENTQVDDSMASFHRFPKDAGRRKIWMELFDIEEEAIKPSSRVCSRYFPGGDSKQTPCLNLGRYNNVRMMHVSFQILARLLLTKQ